METRIAVMGIIIEDIDAAEELNSVLHDYGMYIIGRMGIPYRDRYKHREHSYRCASGCYCRTCGKDRKYWRGKR